MVKSAPPPRTGSGFLFLRGEETPVAYSFRVRDGAQNQKTLIGSIEGDADRMREAFRSTSARLRLDDGSDHEILMVGHSDGEGRAYFESSVPLTGPAARSCRKPTSVVS